MADEVKPQIFIENFSIKEINRSICISSAITSLFLLLFSPGIQTFIIFFHTD